MPAQQIGRTMDSRNMRQTRGSLRFLPHVATATRATAAQEFGPLTNVDPGNEGFHDQPSWVSPDGCRLYMTRPAAGSSDIYVASR